MNIWAIRITLAIAFIGPFMLGWFWFAFMAVLLVLTFIFPTETRQAANENLLDTRQGKR